MWRRIFLHCFTLCFTVRRYNGTILHVVVGAACAIAIFLLISISRIGLSSRINRTYLRCYSWKRPSVQNLRISKPLLVMCSHQKIQGWSSGYFAREQHSLLCTVCPLQRIVFKCMTSFVANLLESYKVWFAASHSTLSFNVFIGKANSCTDLPMTITCTTANLLILPSLILSDDRNG